MKNSTLTQDNIFPLHVFELCLIFLLSFIYCILKYCKKIIEEKPID